MSTLNALIVDDEQDSLDLLELQLNKNCPDVKVIGKCNSAKAALISLQNVKPDIIFLDINMPLISGLELIEMMPKGNYEVVFITAFEHYAVKAFKTSAVDYLLKPISADDLKNTLSLIRSRQNSQLNNKLEFLATQMQAVKEKSVQKIMLPTIDGMSFVYLEDIILCESAENYSNIYLSNNQKLFILKPLKFIEEILSDYEFLRIHKSYMINLNKIKTYNKTDGGFLIMENEMKVNISRTKKTLFLNYIESQI